LARIGLGIEAVTRESVYESFAPMTFSKSSAVQMYLSD